MRLHYYQGALSGQPAWRNFGDGLNPWFWSQLLSHPFTDDPEDPEVFVGIGTILNETLPAATVLHIMGSGAGYGKVGARIQPNWRVHCVRGPLTARAIGVPEQLAIADPAILIPRLPIARAARRTDEVGFMPHVSMDNPRMQQVAERAGLRYISPAWERDAVTVAIDSCDRLVTSAMHGAIAADALRVPWLPCVTSRHIHRFKWEDWCASMAVAFEPVTIPALWASDASGAMAAVKSSVKDTLAAARLRSLARSGRFVCSSDALLRERTERLSEVIAEFDASCKAGHP